MAGWFQDHVRDFIPQQYLTGESSADLRTFLQLPLEELDRFKELADRFPDLFDVALADPIPLSLLGQGVGINVDGTSAPEIERRRIMEAIPRFQRKGTLPALERDLRALGWDGLITENYRDACRLNLRADLNRCRLAGIINSHGVYQIQSFNHVQGLRDAQRFHHPAGTRAFWMQWFLEQLSLVEGVTADSAMHLRYLIYGNLDETFILNRSHLGDCTHLTRKQRAWGLFQITSVSEVNLTVDRATTCVSRWHGRQNRMRLNRKPLNQWRIPNCWESEIKYIECHNIYGASIDAIQSQPLELGSGKLNKDSLSLGLQDRVIRFKKKDFFAVDQMAATECLGDVISVGFVNRNCTSPVLRMNQNALRHGSTLGCSRQAETGIIAYFGLFGHCVVQQSINRVDRYRPRSASFRLNGNALNSRILTNTSLTGVRAAFEVRTDTSDTKLPSRPSMVLTTSKLNRSSLHSIDNDFRWLIRQQDMNSIDQAYANIHSASVFRITQWANN